MDRRLEETNWKLYAQNDSEGLRPFVEDLVGRMVKAGVLPVKNDEEAERREQQAWDEMMKELKDHIENWHTSRCVY